MSAFEKWTKFSTFQLSTYSKDRRFSIAYYILKWVFEIWAEKECFLHKRIDKSLVNDENAINEISEKMQ